MGISKNDERHLKMSLEELEALPDNKLFWSVMVRTECKVGQYTDWEEGVNALNPYQKVFYSINWLDTEVNNGGLCQFFVNSSRMVAPFVSEYMAVIGAHEHKALYDEFITKYEINLEDLSSFDSENSEEFEKQYEKYPFDEYDEAFYEMEPLETYLTKYARENLIHF